MTNQDQLLMTLVEISVRLGKLDSRVQDLEKRVEDISIRAAQPLEKADEVAQTLSETVEALKSALSQNLKMVEDYLSFDIDSQGNLKEMQLEEQEERI